jgi:Putative zinc-finger
MNCDEYIDGFLSAHADDQLTAAERLLVEEHLHSCHKCRARLIEEHSLKAHIRHHATIVKTPADVRLRIRAALGEAVERDLQQPRSFERAKELLTNHAARRPPAFRTSIRTATSTASAGQAIYRSASARGWLALQLKRVQYLAPVGFVVIMLAGAAFLLRLNFKSVSGLATPEYQRTIPIFDFAIDRFNRLSEEFAPNAPPEAYSRDDGAYFAWVEESNSLRHVSAELPDISTSYEKVQMLPEFCDFALAGYELVGGRIDHTPDGAPVTYTLYRNQAESILSIGLKQRISAPEGGYWLGTHALYAYRNYSLCLTIEPVGQFVSIIVVRAPMVTLLRDVAASDIALRDR